MSPEHPLNSTKRIKQVMSQNVKVLNSDQPSDVYKQSQNTHQQSLDELGMSQSNKKVLVTRTRNGFSYDSKSMSFISLTFTFYSSHFEKY